jgi:hypothetical protein
VSQRLTGSAMESFANGNLAAFDTAMRYADACVKTIPSAHRQVPFLSHDVEVRGLMIRAMVRAFAGYLDHGMTDARRGLDLARKQGNPYNLSFALGLTGIISGLREDWSRLLEVGDELTQLATEQGFSGWVAHARAAALLAGTASNSLDLKSASQVLLSGKVSPGLLKRGALSHSAALTNLGQYEAACQSPDSLIGNTESMAKVPEHTAGELRLARTRVLEQRRQVLGDITLRAVLDSYETALVALRAGGVDLLDLSATTALAQRLVENDARAEAASGWERYTRRSRKGMTRRSCEMPAQCSRNCADVWHTALTARLTKDTPCFLLGCYRYAILARQPK